MTAVNFLGDRFEFEVVNSELQAGQQSLDIRVLRLCTPRPVEHLTLPAAQYDEDDILGRPVSLLNMRRTTSWAGL